MDLAKQYNGIADDFSNVNDDSKNSNRDNRKMFYSHLNFIKPGVELLDMGCGDGTDLVYYKSLGAKIYGLDASERLIEIAKSRLPEDDIRLGTFEKAVFPESSFDIVLSKYAIQTAIDMKPVFDKIHKLLKPGGVLMYLVTHPFRQYFEKKQIGADYFKQKVVDSLILNDSMIVREPSHTMNEYLSDDFLRKFDVLLFKECWDPSAEQVEGRKYPGYFILKARKRI